ncbi:hypothetical protein ACFSJU_13765 [Paradesertivirga mongoliensis]|uniref:Nuclear transport factor 2 family protein n=1 Tax=Paradesertivirga mongoliensis TaxID=2100740 RepID=A0ABW4ZMY5_9SPHI|nr:hypothetical protein [Pedobacter mongoliensis]
MTIHEIDKLTGQFYECICFKPEHYPKYDQLQELFYGDGKLINGNYDQPLEFTVQSYIQAIMHQIDDGNATFYSQQEISDVTEVFGKTAQRISVYEYSFTAENTAPWKRGVNYIQFILVSGEWKIVSMLWNDEKEELAIPEAYLV